MVELSKNDSESHTYQDGSAPQQNQAEPEMFSGGRPEQPTMGFPILDSELQIQVASQSLFADILFHLFNHIHVLFQKLIDGFDSSC